MSSTNWYLCLHPLGRTTHWCYIHLSYTLQILRRLLVVPPKLVLRCNLVRQPISPTHKTKQICFAVDWSYDLATTSTDWSPVMNGPSVSTTHCTSARDRYSDGSLALHPYQFFRKTRWRIMHWSIINQLWISGIGLQQPLQALIVRRKTWCRLRQWKS